MLLGSQGGVFSDGGAPSVDAVFDRGLGVGSIGGQDEISRWKRLTIPPGWPAVSRTLLMSFTISAGGRCAWSASITPGRTCISRRSRKGICFSLGRFAFRTFAYVSGGESGNVNGCVGEVIVVRWIAVSSSSKRANFYLVEEA